MYRERAGLKYRAPSEIARELDAAEAEKHDQLRSNLSKRRSLSESTPVPRSPVPAARLRTATRKLSSVQAMMPRASDKRGSESVPKPMLPKGVASTEEPAPARGGPAAAAVVRAASFERRKRPSVLQLLRLGSLGKAASGAAAGRGKPHPDHGYRSEPGVL